MIPLEKWQAESLRLSAFLSPRAEFSESGSWWEEGFGEKPESRSVRPRSGELEEKGTVDGADLSLAVEPSRIDWRLSPRSSDKSEGENIATLGAYKSALHAFSARMEAWLGLGSLPPITRLAFGAVVVIPVESRREGYEHLATLLPGMRIDPSDATDFLYQINRPRVIAGLPVSGPINRLSKWSVAAYAQLVLVRLAGQGSAGVRPKTVGNASQVEVDISTPVETYKELPRETLKEIFRSLRELGTEIIEKGDIA